MAEKKVTATKSEDKPAVKLVKKDGKEVKDVKAEFSGEFFYGLGRRKTAIAQVRLYPVEKSVDSEIEVNGKKFKAYFKTLDNQNTMLIIVLIF